MHNDLQAKKSIRKAKVRMPYTALQTLGWLASYSKWERAYNVNRAFLRYTTQQQEQKCSILIATTKAQKKKRREERNGKGRSLTVVFKTMAAKGGAKVAKCKSAGEQEMQQGLSVVKGHAACGLLDCKVCSVFFGIFCEDTESLCKAEDDDCKLGTTLKEGNVGL